MKSSTIVRSLPQAHSQVVYTALISLIKTTLNFSTQQTLLILPRPSQLMITILPIPSRYSIKGLDILALVIFRRLSVYPIVLNLSIIIITRYANTTSIERLLTLIQVIYLDVLLISSKRFTLTLDLPAELPQLTVVPTTSLSLMTLPAIPRRFL